MDTVASKINHCPNISDVQKEREREKLIKFHQGSFLRYANNNVMCTIILIIHYIMALFDV